MCRIWLGTTGGATFVAPGPGAGVVLKEMKLRTAAELVDQKVGETLTYCNRVVTLAFTHNSGSPK